MRPVIGSGLAGMSVLALTATLSVASAAEAKPYAWCVFYDPSTYNCGFTTYEQCMQTARGNGGFCRPNPFEDTRGQQRRSRQY
jgi:hypothetical protein